MAETFTKQLLSGSTDGLPIKITQTSIASGDTIHTAHASAKDEVWIWAQNSNTADLKLTLGWGGTTDPDHIFEYTVPAEDGLHLIVPGLPLTNSKVVRAAAASANLVLLVGYVNRITTS